MEICCTNLSYLNLNFNDFLTKIKNNGYRNIELAPFIYKSTYEKKDIYEIKKIIDKKKISIKSIQSIFSNMCIDDDNSVNIEIMYEKINQKIEKKKILKVKNISYGSSPIRRLKNDNKNKVLNILIIKKLANLARKINSNILIEPIGNKYNNNYLVNINEIINMIKELKISNLKMLVDTGNLMLSKINFNTFYKNYKKNIEHIHVSNKNIYSYNKNLILKHIEFLKKEKYTNSVTIEYISKYGINLEHQNEILKRIKK